MKPKLSLLGRLYSYQVLIYICVLESRDFAVYVKKIRINIEIHS